MISKKAISPVVAIALLLIISVVAVVGFQSWYQNYSSSMFVKTEKDSEQTSQTNIETLVNNQLYFKNNFDENLTISQIKIGNRECNISIDMSPGVHNISLGECVDNYTSNIYDIVVFTDKQIFNKKVFNNQGNSKINSQIVNVDSNQYLINIFSQTGSNSTNEEIYFNYSYDFGNFSDKSYWQWYINDIPVNGQELVYSNQIIDTSWIDKITICGNYIWGSSVWSDEVYKFYLNGTFTGFQFNPSETGPKNIAGIECFNNSLFLSISDQTIYNYYLNGTFTGKSYPVGFYINGITSGGGNFWSLDSAYRMKKHDLNNLSDFVEILEYYSLDNGNDNFVGGTLFTKNRIFVIDNADEGIYVYNSSGVYSNVFLPILGIGSVASTVYDLTYFNGYYYFADYDSGKTYKFYSSIINSSMTSPGDEIRVELIPSNGLNNFTKISSQTLIVKP